MNNHSFYDLATGIYTGRSFTGSDEHLAANTPAGCGAAPGLVDHLAVRFDLDLGHNVEYFPDAPLDDEMRTWEWDEIKHRWLPVPTAWALGVRVRAERDALLAACDWVVARASEREEPVPIEWRVYRQALRDITTQIGYPREVAWPTSPT